MFRSVLPTLGNFNKFNRLNCKFYRNISTFTINKFTESDLNIGCIKHAHHNFELDIPGKDSYEIRKSGAAPMIISSKKRFALIHENKKNNEKIYLR